MPFNDEHRRSKGAATSREFWIGAFVTLMALAIGVSTFQMVRGWLS